MAVDEWEYQDAQKVARTEAEAAMRLAEAREAGIAYRTGKILYYETQLELLEESIPRIAGEVETYAGIMAENTQGETAWNEAYAEYEDFEEELEDLEAEELEYEEALEGLQEEQLWDETAGIYDRYVMAEREYELAVDREYHAEQAYWDAEDRISDAQDDLWDAQFASTTYQGSQGYIDAMAWLASAQEESVAAEDHYWAAWEEYQSAQGDYWDVLYALEEAEEAFWESDYDPTFEYIDYNDWVEPEDYADYFEYGFEDCDEDADQYECMEECIHARYPEDYAHC